MLFCLVWFGFFKCMICRRRILDVIFPISPCSCCPHTYTEIHLPKTQWTEMFPFCLFSNLKKLYFSVRALILFFFNFSLWWIIQSKQVEILMIFIQKGNTEQIVSSSVWSCLNTELLPRCSDLGKSSFKHNTGFNSCCPTEVVLSASSLTHCLWMCDVDDFKIELLKKKELLFTSFLVKCANLFTL